jgi:hypothetical protein
LDDTQAVEDANHRSCHLDRPLPACAQVSDNPNPEL